MTTTRSPTVTIGPLHIGRQFSPVIVAELSGNHNGSFEQAIALVDAAAESGAHAVKLQTYAPDTMTLEIEDKDFIIQDPASPWAGMSLVNLYRKAQTPWEWHAPIIARCQEKGLVCFSTPFSESAVDFLETLNVPAYKISSFEIVDHPLIKKVASTGKTLLISTGMATLLEIEEAISVIRNAGGQDIILLKCTSAYPASSEEANLLTIPYLERRFDVVVGISDHSLGLGVSLTAVALGASVVERHLTIRRSDGGTDAAFSMEPEELRELIEESGKAWQSLGDVTFGPTVSEQSSLLLRRSLYVVENMKKGEVFEKKNIRSIRPSYGLSPKYLDKIIGKKASRDIKRGTPASWDLFS